MVADHPHQGTVCLSMDLERVQKRGQALILVGQLPLVGKAEEYEIRGGKQKA